MTTFKMPDRRSAVKALALTAFAASPAAAATPFVDRSAWDAAVSTYERAEAAYFAADDAYGLARDGYLKARPVKPANSFTHHDHEPRAEFDRKSAELKARMDAWRTDDAACRKAYRVVELNADLDQASADMIAAFDAMMATPAPDIAAVAQKLEAAMAAGIDLDDVAPILADLRRLGGLAA